MWTRDFLFILSFVGFCGSASAIPATEDFWRLDCDTGERDLDDFKEDVDDADSDVEKGIALLKYACALSADEFQQYEKTYLAYAEKPSGEPPKIDRKRSDSYKKQAHDVLQKAFKAETSTAEFLYYYGFALAFANDEWAVNRFDSAAAMFEETNYPELSTLALAEVLFDLRGFDKAQPYYKKAAASADPFVNAYANYKLAWINLGFEVQKKNLSEQYNAIQSIGSTINAKGSGHRLEALKGRAKDEFLNILREYEDMGRVRTILTNIDGLSMYARVLANRGYYYSEKGNEDSAYKHFQLALAEAKTDEMAPEMELHLLSIDAGNKRISNIVERLKKMASLYADSDSAWAKTQTKKVLEATKNQIIKTTYDYATSIDAQGRKEENKTYLAAAKDLYEHFLKTFPDSDLKYDVKFYLAQLILIDMNYDLAAKYFDELYEDYPKGKHTKETLDFLVSSTQKSIEIDKNNYNLPKPGQGKEKIDLPKNRILFIKVLDTHSEISEKHPDLPTMKYLAASVYYDFGHYGEAEDRYIDFIKEHPTHEGVLDAAERMVKYYKAQDEDELEDFIEDLNEVEVLAKNKMLQVILGKKK